MAGTTAASETIELFLCGDVMPGRGIDQVLPHPVNPVLYEPYVRDARTYVELAEAASGPIPRPVGFDHLWGDALAVLRSAAPAVRLINLETSITTHDEPWPGKGINYRMHPDNAPGLTAMADGCTLANNHVLDWSRAGLLETLRVLDRLGIRRAGAGENLEAARAPAVFELTDGGRVLLFGLGHGSSGIPPAWGAAPDRPGVRLLPDFSDATVDALARQCRAAKREGDIAIASVHWGGNWGYAVPREQRAFARALVDQAGFDLIHGHSSHHVKGFEVYRGHLILYGCGDFLNDYEGIGGYESYRGDLSLMYFPRLERSSGRLRALRLVPMQVRRFRLGHTSEADGRWLATLLTREGRPLKTAAEWRDGVLWGRWE